MGWPWTRRGPVEDDLRALKRQQEDLAADVRRLQAEWLDMYEKLTRRDERLRKREERAGQASATPNPDKASLWARVRSQPHSNGRT